MRLTRKIMAEFVGVFLVGALAGGLVTSHYTNQDLSSFMSRTNDPDSLVTRINKKYADEYGLSADELNRIQPDIREMAQAMYRERHAFGVDVIATLDRYHGQIAAKLNPEHRQAYETAVSDRRKKLSALLMLDQGSPALGDK